MTNQEIGGILKNLRETAHKTREEVGELLGKSAKTVGHWETGYASPDANTLFLLCKIYGADLNQSFGFKTIRPKYSQGALQLARDYDELDKWGRETVRAVTDKELARCADEERFREETAEPAEPRQIPLYLEPAAAGIPAPVAGRDYEIIDLGPDDPQGAAYAVRLQGDSMAPDFPDGCTVFVNHDSLADGDIGIFSVDSGTVCKQYHRDALGMVYLFSLNRKRQDADIVIPPSSNQTLVCQGRVMTRKRYPVPGL